MYYIPKNNYKGKRSSSSKRKWIGLLQLRAYAFWSSVVTSKLLVAFSLVSTQSIRFNLSGGRLQMIYQN